jgi:hypothetical protein
MSSNPSRASPLVQALIGAALLLSLTAALTLLSPEYISTEFARRLLGVIMGCVVVLYANAVPKALTPLIRMRCSPAREQSIRRFYGWGLVLGGLGYAVAWLVAPLERANLLAAGLLGTALLAVVVRHLWAIVGRSRR